MKSTQLKIFVVLLLAGLVSGCATRGGWPTWSFEKNTDQKEEAAGLEYWRTNKPVINTNLPVWKPAQLDANGHWFYPK